MLGRALRKALVINATERPFLMDRGWTTIAGVRVSASSALRASAVWSATSLIAQTIAALPIRFLLRDDESRKPQRPPEARVLWDRPNPYQTTTPFIETVLLSHLLWGNIYIVPRYRNSGDAMELWPLDPERVTEIEPIDVAGTVGLRFRVEGYKEVTNLPGERAGMIHIPDVTAPGRIKGISRVEQLAELIGMSLSAQEHAARFLGEGVHMSGVISTAKSLNTDQAKELWDGFQKIHAGPSKAGRVGVLTSGAEFKPLTIPPAELQFLEQMKYSDRKIAGIYRVPPHMIGDIDSSTSWGTGIEEQTIQFIQHTLLPIIRKVEEAFEATLLAGTNYRMRFITAGLLRGAMKDRAEFYRVLFNMGALNDDEIRAFEDMGPLPDGRGQTYYVPMNIAPVGMEITLKDRAEIAGSLIRAGYTPEEVARVAGIAPIEHLGLPPGTLQSSDGSPPDAVKLLQQMASEGRS